jgi:hypothetical protein
MSTETPRTVEQRLAEWAKQPGAVVTKQQRDFISAMRWFASLGVGYGWMQQWRRGSGATWKPARAGWRADARGWG